MMTSFRRGLRRGIAPGLALILGASIVGGNPALAQKPADPPPKEVTDGFFNVPERDKSQDGPEIGMGTYTITSIFAGLAIFVLCKSARRS